MAVTRPFELKSEFSPTGDQPEAIKQLVNGINEGRRKQVLLGATGTGKTFTMANVIERVGRPTLVISHNKTLAAQLFEELRELFPENAVSYFVSYYDYYQPEAYIPARDIYIEKDASRNDDLDRLRLAATSSLLSRRDVIVVASVSCLYGLGSPAEYAKKTVMVEKGRAIDRRKFLLALADMQYVRNEVDPVRGQFRVKGDCIEVYPAYEEFAIRIDLWGDEVESLQLFDPLTGEQLADEHRVFVFPAVHYVMPEDHKASAIASIRSELVERVEGLKGEGKLLEAQRLLGRTRYDLEMIEEVGYCSGVENYARHFDGRLPGVRSFCLFDYFRHGFAGETGVGGDDPDDWLVLIDESHVTLPQVRGMYFGDRARKQTLVDHGFRLPSAMDNRPLKFEEFEELAPQTVYVSATPSPYELEAAEGLVVEQVIRPTGLVDPPIELRPARGQVQDLLELCQERAGRQERVLVTALTKRLCEELTDWLDRQGVRVRYLHSEIDTLERLEILAELREGTFDVLVGVNLLREGLDLPEVSLVCILDADKQGFLRSTSSLIQTMGRAARNANSQAIMFADKVTPEMRAAIDEVDRRRAKQLEHNERHGITPKTIQKAIRRGMERELAAAKTARKAVGEDVNAETFGRDELVTMLEESMLEAARGLEFEKAADLRDRINRLKALPEGGELTLEEAGASRTKAGKAGSNAGKSRGRKGRGKK